MRIVELRDLEPGTRFSMRGLPHFRTGEIDWVPEHLPRYKSVYVAGAPCKRGSESREVMPVVPTVVLGRVMPGPYTVSDRWRVEVVE